MHYIYIYIPQNDQYYTCNHSYDDGCNLFLSHDCNINVTISLQLALQEINTFSLCANHVFLLWAANKSTITIHIILQESNSYLFCVSLGQVTQFDHFSVQVLSSKEYQVFPERQQHRSPISRIIHVALHFYCVHHIK